MNLKVNGVIYGRHVELESPTDLPDGALVRIQIEPRVLSLEERKHLVSRTAGAWAGDSSIGEIFEEIEGLKIED